MNTMSKEKMEHSLPPCCWSDVNGQECKCARRQSDQAAIKELVEALEEGHDLITGDLVEGHWKRACRKFTTNARNLITKHKAGA